MIAATAAVLCLACAPKGATNSDVEPVDAATLQRGRSLTGVDPAAALTFWSGVVQRHPDSWAAARGLQDVERATEEPAAFLARYRARAGADADGLDWYLWGRASIDQEAEAREAFTRAASLAPLSPWPAAALAYLHWRRGDLYRTVETYEQALERMPRSATLRQLLGNQLISLQLAVDAQRHLEIADRLAPSDPATLAALGKTYVMLERHEAGRDLLEAALAADPSLGDAARALASVYLRERRTGEAEAMLRRSLELGVPRDEELHGAIRAAKISVRARTTSP